MNNTEPQPKQGYDLTEDEQFTLTMLKIKQTDSRLYDAMCGLTELALQFRSMQQYLIALAEFLRHEAGNGETPGLEQKDPELYSVVLVVLSRALAWPRLCKALGGLAAFSEEKGEYDAKRARRSRRRRAARTDVDASSVTNA